MKCPICSKDTGEDILKLLAHSFMEHSNVIADRMTEISYKVEENGT